MNSEPIPETWRQEYLKRPLAKLPGDLVKACDELRSQRRDIDTLRSQLKWARVKNTILVAILGGASAKGIEIAVLAILKAVGHGN